MWWTLRQLKSKNAETRRRAVEKIARVEDEKTFDMLVEALKDEDGGVVGAAAKALGEIRDQRALDPLLAALKSQMKKLKTEKTWADEKAEDSVIRALREIPNPRAFPQLEAAFHAKDHGEAKYLIIEILGEIGDERCVEKLFDFLKGTDDGYRGAAADALVRVGKGVVPQVIAVLQNSKANAHAREKAILVLEQIKDERGVKPLFTALNDEDSYVRDMAAAALKKFDQRIVKGVQERLADEERASTGIQTLMQCVSPDAVDKEKLLAQAIRELKEKGNEGSKALAELTRELLHSRSKEIYWALLAACEIELVPELSAAVRLAAAASPSRSGTPSRFDPEVVGAGSVGWTEGMHERIKGLAIQILEPPSEEVAPESSMAGASSIAADMDNWMKAISSQDTGSLVFLMDKVSDINANDEKGNTALIVAAGRYDNNLLLNLLLKGADYNARNADGRTALIQAAASHHTEAVRILLECGAPVNSQDDHGWTALIWSYEDPETLQVLIGAGADVNARNRQGRSALMLAARAGHTKIVGSLVAAGADVRAKDSDGNSPLMWAGAECHTDVVDILRNAGA
jgi:HEAT repeat protein